MNTIYTVETGEYSDHTIHGFCTSLDEARKVAEQVLRRYRDMYMQPEDDPISEYDVYHWPRVFSNRANVLCSYVVGLYPIRVKWCERDPVAA
jgi:hypothetical protein